MNALCLTLVSSFAAASTTVCLAAPVVYMPRDTRGVFGDELYQWYGPGCLSNAPSLVGYATTADGTRAFRWSPTLGMQSLGALPIGAPPPNGRFVSIAQGTSRDGNTVVGLSTNIAGGGGPKAFRWTSPSGMLDVGAGQPSAAMGVSGDGLTVFGNVSSLSDDWVWRSGLGFTTFDRLPSGGRTSPTSASFAGEWFTGAAYDAGGSARATRWTGTHSPQVLSLPGGVNAESSGVVVSDDGAWIGGNYYLPGGTRPFRWSVASELSLDLGVPAGALGASVLDMSRDGALAVIEAARNDGGNVPYIWTASGGLETGWDFFVSRGVDLAGWSTVERVWSVSPDGLKFAGYGTMNVDGSAVPRTFVIDLVPSPGAGTILLVAGSWSWRRRRATVA